MLGQYKPHGTCGKPAGYLSAWAVFQTTPMLSIDEKSTYSGRLNQAIKRRQKLQLNANELSTQFSLWHPNESISPQAAQKSLTGKAKPTAERAKTLAEWLDLTFHCLSYGLTRTFQKKI